MSRHYVLVCGSHTTCDPDVIVECIDALHALYGEDLRVMHGDAQAVDRTAAAAAQRRGVPVKAFPADWTAHGKKAGPVRNEQMAEYLDWCRAAGHTVQVVAFRGGPGTEDMVRRAESRGIDVDRWDA